MKRIFNIILPIILWTTFLPACTHQGSNERRMDSTEQSASTLEDIEVDSSLNQIDSSSDTSKTINENIAARRELSILTSGIETAELIPTLSGPGPITIFAPSDSAFRSSGINVKDLQKSGPDKKLQKVLMYHIVSGFYSTEDLKNGMELTTAQGDKIKISIDSGVYRVNDARVTTRNIISKNGVIHVLDKVILPAP